MVSRESIIVVTGAAGFIGSCMAGYLNEHGFQNLILVDEFNEDEKELNLHEKNYAVRVERENFFEWLNKEKPDIKFVFHLGARTDTTEFDYAVHQHLNVEFSQKIWNYCSTNNVPLVYASSAATYGGGEFGYSDEHAIIEKLQPLNPYGISKNEFDKWALQQNQKPPFWAGLKFFNVYGPNEFHKGRMASMIFHGFNQIKQNGFVKLFKSHKKDIKDGEQLRDFIYVKDVIKMCYWFMEAGQQSEVNSQQKIQNGIYNIGTGEARSFKDLVKATFTALDMKPEIKYIDMPQDIRDKYQYFTEAEMNKIRLAGYSSPLYTLEEGVGDYVSKYLSHNRFL
ncbi:MAG TPA: ADP-glyceromanno-heptose 6-epimerase [Chitinophagaceae bacterium]|nr:ADP-glyceromanno-heptose 6-epimerase [Chitinophagaceae bacterium]